MGPVRQNPIQRTVSLFICVCSSLCTTVAHNTAQNRPDNFPSCPPDNHHCSDVYLRERGGGQPTAAFLVIAGCDVRDDNQSNRAFVVHEKHSRLTNHILVDNGNGGKFSSPCSKIYIFLTAAFLFKIDTNSATEIQSAEHTPHQHQIYKCTSRVQH